MKGVEAREEIHDYRKYLPHLEVLLIPLAGEHFQSIDSKSRISPLASGSSPNSAKKMRRIRDANIFNRFSKQVGKLPCFNDID